MTFFFFFFYLLILKLVKNICSWNHSKSIAFYGDTQTYFSWRLMQFSSFILNIGSTVVCYKVKRICVFLELTLFRDFIFTINLGFNENYKKYCTKLHRHQSSHGFRLKINPRRYNKHCIVIKSQHIFGTHHCVCTNS
jgi:hypothetical protein